MHIMAQADLRRVDLNLLVVFDAVMRARNLSAAGQALGLSQPAMSHALNRLRETFKDPLFVRLPRGLQPTPYAEGVAGAVQQMLELVRGTLDRVGFDPRTASRRLRIAMTDIGEFVFLPRLASRLAALAPGISIESVQIPVDALRDAMAAGEVDLAMGFIPQLSAGFRQQRLFRDDYACIVREDHPRVRDGLGLKAFREARHVLVASEGTGHGEVIGRALARKSVKAAVALRVVHFLAVPQIVAGSDLVAVLPRNLARAFADSHPIRLFDSPIELPPFDVRQYWHERYHREPGNRWLRGVAAELFLA